MTAWMWRLIPCGNSHSSLMLRHLWLRVPHSYEPVFFNDREFHVEINSHITSHHIHITSHQCGTRNHRLFNIKLRGKFTHGIRLHNYSTLSCAYAERTLSHALTQLLNLVAKFYFQGFNNCFKCRIPKNDCEVNKIIQVSFDLLFSPLKIAELNTVLHIYSF